MSDQELIWVPADVAAVYKELEGKTAEDYILKYYELRRKDVEQATALLDEDIVAFKAKGIAYKRAFEAAFENEKAALDELNEKSQVAFVKARETAKDLASQVAGLTQDIRTQAAAVNEALNTLRLWQLGEAVETLASLQAALQAVTPQTERMLRILLEKPE